MRYPYMSYFSTRTKRALAGIFNHPLTIIEAPMGYGKTTEYYNRVKCIFDLNEKEELLPLLRAFNEGALRKPSLQFRSVNPGYLLNYNDLAIKP